MLKTALSIIAISLIGCGTLIPKIPRHTQYGIHADINPPGFYGVDNETKERKHKLFSDPSMKGGQCLDNKDYKALQAWVKVVKEIGETHCK